MRSAIRDFGQPSRRGTVAMFSPIVMVREEADLLDHIADAAAQLGGRQVADAPPVDADVARVEGDQPVDHLQRRRLAAARRADEDAERPGRDLEREIVERGGVASRIALRDVVEDDLRGGASFATGFRIPAQADRGRRRARAAAVIPIASWKPVQVELVLRAGDRRADDGDPEQARDARDGVVHAAGDPGVALARRRRARSR